MVAGDKGSNDNGADSGVDNSGGGAGGSGGSGGHGDARGSGPSNIGYARAGVNSDAGASGQVGVNNQDNLQNCRRRLVLDLT